jgi:ribosomal RNA-processing protein 36
MALKQDGSTSAAAMQARARAVRDGQASFKRTHKHRPAEQSSKKPVPVLRDALQAGKREARDPRFDALTGGAFVEPAFKKRYAFLYDEKLPEERRELGAALKRTRAAPEREALAARLARVTQDLRAEESRRRREAAGGEAKAKERAAVAAGKRPFYLKKSEQKRQELVARYEALKAGGGLEKFMAKRRRKNASKDHRYLPSGRREGGGAGGEEEG